jgi:RimJ/RimL family protein N-acetyltransferase
MTLELFSPQEQIPTDAEILSFWRMMSAPDQTQWDYEDNETFYRKPDEDVIQFFRSKVLARMTALGYWAREDGEIVGMASIHRFAESSREHCGELGFSVHQAYQRRGIGYQLVVAVLGKAREAGLQRIESSCFAHNEPAVKLLRKAGFREEGLRVGAIKKLGRLRDIREFGLLL